MFMGGGLWLFDGGLGMILGCFGDVLAWVTRGECVLESLIAREMRGKCVRLNETCNGIYRQGKGDQKVALW